MGSTIINTHSPTKKMFGDKEVLKEVWNGETVYESGSSEPLVGLFFKSNEQFTLAHNAAKTWDGTLKYSTNGENWHSWEGGTITSGLIEGEYVIILHGIGNTIITGTTQTDTTTFREPFTLTGNGNISISGSIVTLLDYQKYINGEQVGAGVAAFKGLFKDQLKITNCEDMLLDKQIHNTEMYYGLFQGCTGLIKPPKKITCYDGYKGSMRSMFEGCTSLITAPIFDHGTNTDLATYDQIFLNMFKGCTNLIEPLSIMNFKETGTAKKSFNSMYYDCTNLTKLTLPLNSTKCGADACTSMYRNCSKIYVTTDAQSGYSYSFILPPSTASGWANTSYTHMFNGIALSGVATPVASTTYYTSNEII